MLDTNKNFDFLHSHAFSFSKSTLDFVRVFLSTKIQNSQRLTKFQTHKKLIF